jgi:hypothetical protein
MTDLPSISISLQTASRQKYFFVIFQKDSIYLTEHFSFFQKQPSMSSSPFVDQIRDIAISEVVILLRHYRHLRGA